MARFSSSRRVAFGLGVIWGVAGAFALLFGTQMTFPLLPPLGLERVAPIPSLAVAVGLFLLGARLGRRSPDSATANKEVRAESDDVAFLKAGDQSLRTRQPGATPTSIRPLRSHDDR